VTRAKLHLTFPEHAMGEPIVYKLGQDFGLITNIRRANVEERFGWVILEVDGDEDQLARGVSWLEGQGVQVDRILDEDGG
jgi:hypothetical protein